MREVRRPHPRMMIPRDLKDVSRVGSCPAVPFDVEPLFTNLVLVTIVSLNAI